MVSLPEQSKTSRNISSITVPPIACNKTSMRCVLDIASMSNWAQQIFEQAKAIIVCPFHDIEADGPDTVLLAVEVLKSVSLHCKHCSLLGKGGLNPKKHEQNPKTGGMQSCTQASVVGSSSPENNGARESSQKNVGSSVRKSDVAKVLRTELLHTQSKAKSFFQKNSGVGSSLQVKGVGQSLSKTKLAESSVPTTSTVKSSPLKANVGSTSISGVHGIDHPTTAASSVPNQLVVLMTNSSLPPLRLVGSPIQFVQSSTGPCFVNISAVQAGTRVGPKRSTPSGIASSLLKTSVGSSCLSKRTIDKPTSGQKVVSVEEPISLPFLPTGHSCGKVKKVKHHAPSVYIDVTESMKMTETGPGRKTCDNSVPRSPESTCSGGLSLAKNSTVGTAVTDLANPCVMDDGSWDGDAGHLESDPSADLSKGSLDRDDLSSTAVESGTPILQEHNYTSCTVSSLPSGGLSLSAVNIRSEELSCSVCGRMFQNREKLAYHRKLNHLQEQMYVCSSCGVKYRLKSSLFKHYRKKHPLLMRFVCKICGRRYAEHKRLKQHLAVHDPSLQVMCDRCGKVFGNQLILRQHRLYMHKDEYKCKFKCEHCEETFPLQAALNRHKRTENKSRPCRSFPVVREKKPKVKTVCTVCGYKCDCASDLQRHFGIHDPNLRSMCDRCGQVFSSWDVLKQHHVYKHNDVYEGKFKCEHCPETFPTVGGLHRHQKTEDKSRPCRTFPRSRVQKKRNLEPATKSFACPVCGISMASQLKLQRHMDFHSGLRPFKCDKCGMAFQTKVRLQVHMETHSRNRRTFPCDVCSVIFYSKRSLHHHRILVHSAQVPYICDICNKDFASQPFLTRHMREIHSTESSDAAKKSIE